MAAMARTYSDMSSRGGGRGSGSEREQRAGAGIRPKQNTGSEQGNSKRGRQAGSTALEPVLALAPCVLAVWLDVSVPPPPLLRLLANNPVPLGTLPSGGGGGGAGGWVGGPGQGCLGSIYLSSWHTTSLQNPTHALSSPALATTASPTHNRTLSSWAPLRRLVRRCPTYTSASSSLSGSSPPIPLACGSVAVPPTINTRKYFLARVLQGLCGEEAVLLQAGAGRQQ